MGVSLRSPMSRVAPSGGFPHNEDVFQHLWVLVFGLMIYVSFGLMWKDQSRGGSLTLSQMHKRMKMNKMNKKTQTLSIANQVLSLRELS